MLSLDGISKSYGNLRALYDVSFEISHGEMVGVVGPNGAGKTTLFNIVSGVIQPDEGTITFKNRDITRDPEHERANMGISRSYQVNNLFPQLTVFENVRQAILAQSKDKLNVFTDIQDCDEINEEVAKTLELLGLSELRDRESSSLSYGNKRRLEVGLAVASDPDILLLDEPTAGCGEEENKELLRTLDRIQSDQEMSFIIVEHDLELLFPLVSRILLFDEGEKVIDGVPEKVQQSPPFKSAYLGKA